MNRGATDDGRRDPGPFRDLVADYLADDRDGAEALARGLESPLRIATEIMLGEDDRDVDDVVSESVVAVLDYVTRRKEFTGDLEAFAITVARNRCRNLLLWRRRRPHVDIEPFTDRIASPEHSPLDILLDDERLALLQEALENLGPECENLLRDFDIEGIPMEEIRRRMGLRTVQGAYYRRALCIKKASDYLNNRLADCSPHAGPEPDMDPGRETER